MPHCCGHPRTAAGERNSNRKGTPCSERVSCCTECRYTRRRYPCTGLFRRGRAPPRESRSAVSRMARDPDSSSRIGLRARQIQGAEHSQRSKTRTSAATMRCVPFASSVRAQQCQLPSAKDQEGFRRITAGRGKPFRLQDKRSDSKRPMAENHDAFRTCSNPWRRRREIDPRQTPWETMRRGSDSAQEPGDRKPVNAGMVERRGHEQYQ